MIFLQFQASAADIVTIALFSDCPGHGIVRVRSDTPIKMHRIGPNYITKKEPHIAAGPPAWEFRPRAGDYRISVDGIGKFVADNRSMTISVTPGMVKDVDFGDIAKNMGYVDILVMDVSGRPTDNYTVRTTNNGNWTLSIGSFFGPRISKPLELGDYLFELIDASGQVIAKSNASLTTDAPNKQITLQYTNQ